MAESMPGSAETAESKDEFARRFAVIKNTIVLLSLRILIPLLSVALMLILSRKLGAEGVGRYTLVYGYLMLFNTVGPLGLYAVITRDGARQPDRLSDIVGNAFTLGTVCSLLLTGLMAVIGYLLGYDDATRSALLVLSLAVLPYTLGNFIEGAFVALQRTEFIAVATLAEYVLKVGLGVILLFHGYGLDAVLIVAVLGRALGCIIGAILLRRQGVAVRWRRSPELRRLLRLTPTFLAISVFATLYWRIDILMLSKLRTMTEVGYYGASWRLLEFAMVIPTSLCLALYPQIALLIDQDVAKLRRLARTALRYLFALTLPIAVAVTLLSEHLLGLLFGDELRPAAMTLCVLIWTLLPYSLVRYHAYILVAGHRQHIDLWLNIIMSVVNITLNLLLIPRYGTLGAAFATLISICAYSTSQYLYLSRSMPAAMGRFNLAPGVIIAALITAAGIWLLMGIGPVVAMIVSPFLYLALLLASGFVTAEELKMLGLDRYPLLMRLCAGRWRIRL